MIVAMLLLAAGVFLSAFFSGSETGFYRVARLRLLLDAREGDWIARGLLWLANNPTLFVATTLIGNNAANYATSLAIVVAVERAGWGDTVLVELIAPVVFSPFVFVYGELLPKYMFYRAPNRLLRRGGPLLMLCTVLFSPIAALLWMMGRLLQESLGEAPLRVKSTLARKELREALQEGEEAGILQPAQRDLAENLIALAPQPVTRFCAPAARVASVRLGAPKSDLLRLARRHGVALCPVRQSDRRDLVGYVRVFDLCLDDSPTVQTVRPLLAIPHDASHIAALLQMRSRKESLARVVDREGRTIGLLYSSQLTEPLFRET